MQLAQTKGNAKIDRDLEALLQEEPDSIIVTDHSGKIIEVSPSGCTELGYSKDEILQMNYKDVASSGKQRGPDFFKKEQRIPDIFEADYHCKNGQIKRVKVHCCALFHDSRKMFVMVARNLTGQISTRERILSIFKEMRNMERLRAQYICGIVHDLKTPLTALKGFIEILLSRRGGELTAKQEKFLRSCSVAVERENDLIDCLSVYSEARAGKPMLHKGQADIADVLKVSVGLWEPLAELNHIQMEVDIDDEPMVVDGNITELVRIFNNLLSNAIKYNKPEGKVRVTAAIYNTEKVCVSVRDTGVGIPPKEHKKIFERYYRSQSPSSSRVSGHGIGLSVVSELVARHGGEILVESNPDKGSTFYIIFNLLRAPDPAN